DRAEGGDGAARATHPDRDGASDGLHTGLTFAEIRFCTAAELAAALRKRRISAVELARASLDLLGKLGPKYNAVAARTPEPSLVEAKRADVASAQRQAGRRLGGLGCGSRGRSRAVRNRLGDVGLDRYAVRLLRRHRTPSDLRARLAKGGHGALMDARQARTDGAHGR